MAGVTQRVIFLVVTLCRDVSEERRVCIIRLICVQEETEVSTE
jgi:hypothetical protein